MTKKVIIFIMAVCLIGGGLFIYFKDNGHTAETILNSAQNLQVKVDCSSIKNHKLASSVNVTVDNNSDKPRTNVSVRVTAYDKNGDIVKQKVTTFLREIGAKESITKTVTLPAKARTCDCVLDNADK